MTLLVEFFSALTGGMRINFGLAMALIEYHIMYVLLTSYRNIILTSCNKYIVLPQTMTKIILACIFTTSVTLLIPVIVTGVV